MEKTKNRRLAEGWRIVRSMGVLIARDEDGNWVVPSRSKAKMHTVDEEHWTCTCEDFEYRRMTCAHMYAVIITEKIRERARKKLMKEAS